MNEIWIEKYRPKALKDIVGQRDIIDRLESYVQVRNLPHLMFAGPAGTGKTTSAIALAKSLYGDNWKANFNELNASDERGIDVVRGKIKDFARTAPIGGAEFKIIFLDEADALTADAQSALRRTMERYSKTCRFILSCVTPDTTILLSEDREIEIGDFMRKFENREIKDTLGLNEGGKALENDLVLFGMQMSPSANGKRVYELTTMSGRVLKVTEDHPILTNEGWTTVSEIVPGTKGVVYPHLEGTPLEEDPRQVIDVDDLKKFLSDKESDGREGDGEHGGSTTARWDDVGNGMRYLRPLVPQGKGSTVREIKEVNYIIDKDRQVWR
jgi:replication factor C small subunit